MPARVNVHWNRNVFSSLNQLALPAFFALNIFQPPIILSETLFIFSLLQIGLSTKKLFEYQDDNKRRTHESMTFLGAVFLYLNKQSFIFKLEISH